MTSISTVSARLTDSSFPRCLSLQSPESSVEPTISRPTTLPTESILQPTPHIKVVFNYPTPKPILWPTVEQPVPETIPSTVSEPVVHPTSGPVAWPMVQKVEPTSQAPIVSPTLYTPDLIAPSSSAQGIPPSAKLTTSPPSGDITHPVAETASPLQPSKSGRLEPEITLTPGLAHVLEQVPTTTPRPSEVSLFLQHSRCVLYTLSVLFVHTGWLSTQVLPQLFGLHPRCPFSNINITQTPSNLRSIYKMKTLE